MLPIRPANIGTIPINFSRPCATIAAQIAYRITDRSNRIWTMSKRLFKIWY